jgi:hypothetical protein
MDGAGWGFGVGDVEPNVCATRQLYIVLPCHAVVFATMHLYLGAGMAQSA